MTDKNICPPIKWIGNKMYQVDSIVPKILESQKEIYIEPFLGSGAVVIELLKHKSTMKYKCYDINDMIIGVFNEIKNNPKELIAKLSQYVNKQTKEDYYKIRAEYNQEKCVAKFMYLNKTCFRGLYRVNKNNHFNVAFNHAKNPPIYCEQNIMALHELFNSVNITFEVRDYKDVEYCDNSVVYMDPPFYGTFDEYTSTFCHTEYIKTLNRLRQHPSVTLIHSNSATFRDIYKTDEHIEEITLYNRINSKNPSSVRTELLYYS
jgi:DNA adenine methylase